MSCRCVFGSSTSGSARLAGNCYFYEQGDFIVFYVIAFVMALSLLLLYTPVLPSVP